MSKFLALVIVGASVAWLTVARPWTQSLRQSRAASEARIPEFPLKALSSPAAIKAGLFVSKDGTLLRYAVDVGREGVPDWLHAMADEKIGKGEDVVYEAELYPDGSEVYEVYRMIGGKEVQLSVDHRDRSVKYIGTQLVEKQLPEKIRATLGGVDGFEAEKIIFKEGPRFAEYHVKGKIGGVPHRVRIGGDGKLLSVQRRIPAEIEVAVQEGPAAK
jgi:hypothetical protein